MRLWSLHPTYLDSRGLVALWREGLLAQAVLVGSTQGYQRHPQLQRFRSLPNPLAAIAAYLQVVHREAIRRNYRFDLSRVHPSEQPVQMEVTSDQLSFEWEHLLRKLRIRAPTVARAHEGIITPISHPLFVVVPGPVASWERGAA